MKVIDPGHKYSLDSLDGDFYQVLTFVKREGEKYPGNVGHHPGTTMQDVLRCLVSRAKYVNNQKHCPETEIVINLLESAIVILELRAATQHNRKLQLPVDVIVNCNNYCKKCGHVGCIGDCH